MMKNYLIADAILVQMLVCERLVLMQMERIQLEEMPEKFVSLITDPDMADVLEKILKIDVPVVEKQVDVLLDESDTLYVALYKGILPCGTLVYEEDLELYKFEYHETIK